MALFDGEGAPTVILVTLLGVADHHVEEIVTTTRARFVRSRVVYVTDSLDFMRLRRMGAAFEYLPPALDQQLHAGELSWRLYLERRWDLLLAKWKPLHVLSYGQNIETYLRAAPDLARDAGARDEGP